MHRNGLEAVQMTRLNKFTRALAKKWSVGWSLTTPKITEKILVDMAKLEEELLKAWESNK
jgi:hypothetical protein